MAFVHCSQCGAKLPLEAPLRFFYGDKRMCDLKCMHAAGCRSDCGPGCGCTAYAIKRRMLREHRQLMRCMDTIIGENGLDEELDALLRQYQPQLSRSICLASDPELDELSDAEDPEQQLRAELADRSAMIEAVQGALECLQTRARDKRGGDDHGGNDHTAH